MGTGLVTTSKISKESRMKQVTVVAGINVVKCEFHGCPGTAFIPVTMKKVAEIRAGKEHIAQVRATCGHMVDVSFKA